MLLRDSPLPIRYVRILYLNGIETAEQLLEIWIKDYKKLVKMNGLGNIGLVEIRIFITCFQGLCRECGQKLPENERPRLD